jgi:hypothetical protein
MTKPNPVIVTIKKLRGYVAQWAVQQSPYATGPEGLDKVLAEVTKRFHASPLLERLAPPYHHTPFVQLQPRRSVLHPWLGALLLDIPEVAAWNVRKNGREGMGFTDEFSGPGDPDDDFIDLDALVQNIASSLIADSIECTCRSDGLMAARS